MKNFYYTLLLLLPGFMASCYDDKGNYDYHELVQASISGIDSVYTVNIQDQLTISPVVKSDDPKREYDYFWMCYDKHDFRKKIDTLSLEKDLDYKVQLPLSTYQLIFAYRDRETAVTKYIYSNMSVESQYARGWYVMKEKNGNADIDYFYNGTKSEDVLLEAHGEALSGSPRNLGYVDKYTWLDEEKGEMEGGIKCFILSSDKEMRIVRISDMKRLGDMSSLFYEETPSINPQKWYTGSEECGLINDGQLYTYSPYSGELGVAKLAYPKEGDYELSSILTKNGTMSPLLFDLKSGRFCTAARNNAPILFFENDEGSTHPLVHKDFKPVFAGFFDEGMWEGGKGFFVMENKTSHKRYIYYLDMNNLVSWNPEYLKNRITDIQEIEDGSKLAQANCYGMNRKFKMLYFGTSDKLYYYDLAEKKELEVLKEDGTSAIPAGENIAIIKHWILDYSDWQDPSVFEKVNKLAVVTTSGNSYKLYLFDTQANKVKNNPEVFEGSGNPTELVYMSPHMGGIDICY